MHTLPQLLILQHIKRGKLLRIHPLHPQNLNTRPREPTLRRLRRSLHEQHDRGGSNGAVDGLSHFVGEQADLHGCEEAGGEAGGGEDARGLRGAAEGLRQWC